MIKVADIHCWRDSRFDGLSREQVLLVAHAHVVDLLWRLALLELRLKLSLHVIDVRVSHDRILRIFIPEFNLVPEALPELLAYFVGDIVIGQNRLRRVLQEPFASGWAVNILRALKHKMVLLEHAILVLVNFSLNRFVRMRLQVLVVKERCI